MGRPLRPGRSTREAEMDRSRIIPFRGQREWHSAAGGQRQADETAGLVLERLRRHHLPSYEHSLRVADLVRELADRMGWSLTLVRKLARAARLHDVGKVAVPLAILDKAAGLSAGEWSCMDRHSAVGADLLSSSESLGDEAYIVRHHHRWYAANSSLTSGYHTVRDRGIDLLSVCDAFDAMVSERPYRSRRAASEAIDQLEAGAGDQFCPRVVREFRGLVRDQTRTVRPSS